MNAFRFRSTAWLWFLSLALVLQSVAVATMVTCGPAHARMQAGVVEGGDHSHGHHAADSEHHAIATDADGHQGHAGAGDVFQLTCSACASCCAGAAIPVQTVLMESVAASAAALFLASAPAADFVVSRPTPPPRVFLA
ncbi:MAG: hypothetical protein ACREBN_05665 [Burkholderiaceae bacterium]